MEGIVNTLLQQYGIYGILLIMMIILGYLIYGDRKNNWGSKIDHISNKIEGMDSKIEWIETKLSDRMDTVEQKLVTVHSDIKVEERNIARDQSINVMNNGQGGKLSKILRYYCSRINCDHIFMGSFHNGTTDLRGLHYCKFDILIDEFINPLKLHDNDTDFQPLYKDENVIAYGDLPYKMTHVDAVILNIDKDAETLLDLSDTIYRRCKSRDIKSIGFICIHDSEGYVSGFIGCVTYDDKEMNIDDLKACAHEIENIYNNQ